MIETEIGKVETEKLNNLLLKYFGETLIAKKLGYYRISKHDLLVLKEVRVSYTVRYYGCDFVFYSLKTNENVNIYTYQNTDGYNVDKFANFIKSQFFFLVPEKKKIKTIGTKYQEILEKRNKETRKRSSSMLEVQKYLQIHSLNDLAAEHGVYSRWSTKNPNKFTLNYDMLEAKDNDPVSQECRGLVLQRINGPANLNEIIGETKILAFPFRRFFNYGQGSAANIDFKDENLKYFEKLDGTNCIVYFDSVLNNWCVATRSVPDADLPIDGFDKTFTELFKKAFKETSNHDFSEFGGNKAYTYIFELCTPENQIVVYYPKYEIYLLGIRNIETTKEVSIDNYCSYSNWGVPCAPSYKLKTIEQMIQHVSDINPSEHEGLVVCDPAFNRIKVKSPGYLALNRLKDSIVKSPRAIIEVILLEKEDDVMPLVPEHMQKTILEYKDKIRCYMKKLDDEHKMLYNEDRKTFALAVQAVNSNMGYHMQRWAGKAKNTHDWLNQQKQKDGTYSNTTLDNVMSWVK